MKKIIPVLKSTVLSLLISLLAFQHSSAGAANEDSCLAMMLVMPDHNDPLLVHFYFSGNVPINSFQFLGSWDFGDGFTSTDSCPDHQYSQPGTYVVCLSFSICIGGGMSCHDDTCVTMTIGTMAGIGDDDGSLNAFYSYPVPFQHEFFSHIDAKKVLALKMRDLSGRIVLDRTVKNDEAIEAASFSNGIYFLELTDGTRSVSRKLVIGR